MRDTKPEDTTRVPWLFRALSCERPTTEPSRHRLDGIDSVELGRGAFGAKLQGKQLLVCVDDGRVSSSHARLVKVFGRWSVEDAGSRNGTLVNGVKQARVLLADNDVIEIGR